MPNMRLGKENVNRVVAPDKGAICYWDTKLKGFGLKVTPTSLIYIVQARVQGSKKLVRVTIGKHGVFTPAQAEEQAKQVLGSMAKGIDPNQGKKAERVLSLTLGEAFEEYKGSRTLRQKTLSVYNSAMVRCFPDWQDKRVVDISKDAVQKRFREIANANGPRGKGEAQASQAMRLLRSVLNYAGIVHEDADGKSLLPDNPVKRLSQVQRNWSRVAPRRDVIERADMEKWYHAVQELPNPVMRDYFLICLLLGLRRTEAATLTWNCVDFQSRTITIPKEMVKTNQEHRLPLPTLILDLLKRRDANRTEDSNYVFPGKGSTEHVEEPKRAVARVIEKSGVKFSMHTLRRTFATTAERLDISYYKLKRLLNHAVSGDVTGHHYVHIDTEELREALEQISDYFSREMGIEANAHSDREDHEVKASNQI